MQDNLDVACYSHVQGDTVRRTSLDTLNARYCIEILLVWFQCYFQLGQFQLCSSFLSFVEL